MPLTEHTQARCGKIRTLLLVVASSFPIVLVSCSNSCFVFISNPSVGNVNIKVGDQKSPCMLTTANGAVEVLAHTDLTCTSCSPSTRIAHLFISLASIQIHPSAFADDGSPDWQELLPQLAAQPRQFDLVSSAAGQGAALPLGEGATIPADTYRQLRLRFVPNQPALDDLVPKQNACGRVGFNCVVSEDDHIYPLLLDGSPPELRIAPEKIESGFLVVAPSSYSNLVIEFKAGWLLSPSIDQGVRLGPLLNGSARLERRSDETLDVWKQPFSN